jgi:hypothetical protein
MMYIMQYDPESLDFVSRTDYCGEGGRDRREIATAWTLGPPRGPAVAWSRSRTAI